MVQNNGGIGKTIKRELIRAVLERSQSFDIKGMTLGGKGSEETIYDNVDEELNIPYVNRDEVPLAMDVFKPKDSDDKELPVVVTIHGGGLTMGDRSFSRPFGRLLAHKGYLVFSVEYRLAPRANVCEELDDLCAGLDLVGRMLVDYNVDFNRIFLMSESAGAYLALYVAAMRGSVRLQEAIGYEPSKVRFKALGLNSGMFYTNRNDPCGWMLSEQIYGEKRTDENFLQYMNPENPEIINNLPPVFLATSRGDFMNNYSFMLHKALEKAGKISHFLYYPDEGLGHAYFAMQTSHPLTLEAIDKTLAWCEEQALKQVEQHKNEAKLEKLRAKIEKSIENGSIYNQSICSFIKEVHSAGRDDKRDIAVIDCTGEYTYEQMFEQWDAYARVFSALDMTEKNTSRVGIAGAICAEPLFAFYGLNMTGAQVSMLSYPDFLPSGQWKTMVKKEKLTDLILTDIMVTPDLWREIQRERDGLGLKNVILLHSRLGGPCVGPAELIFDEFNYHALKTMEGTVFMDELISEYAETPISYGSEDGERIAIITHTSGTTKGTRKPLPYTNRAINSTSMAHRAEFASVGLHLRIAPSFDFSSYLNVNVVNCALAVSNVVVLTFFGFLHPKFVRAVDYYKLDVLFTSGFMFDKWLERKNTDDINFTSLRMLACGGSYVSPEKLKRYTEFAREHGYRHEIVRGYGMSETGSAQLTVPTDCKEDIIGYPNPKENFRIQDEDDQQFYTVDDGVRTGTMYIASDSLCLNELDGETLFEYTQIDGRNFICTNDLIRVNEDGSFSYAGRADRYFVNNDGVRFDPGIVEVKMSAMPEVDRCAVVPVLDKRIHDTVPVLYVIPARRGPGAEESIRRALVQAFVTDGSIAGSNLPSQFVLVDDIPCNSNGKIDIYRITRDRLNGQAFNIVPVKDGDRLTDIRIEFSSHLDSIRAGTLPEGMGENSVLGIFDLFNSQPSNDAMSMQPFPFMGFSCKKKKGITTNKMPEMPPEFMQAAMKMMGKLYGKKEIDQFIENDVQNTF